MIMFLQQWRDNETVKAWKNSVNGISKREETDFSDLSLKQREVTPKENDT